VIKRSYIDEYLYLFFMLVTSSILLYALVTFMQIDARSFTFSYLVLNISIIISLNNFLAYFLIETKVPDWLRKNKPHIDARYGNVPISFLLPAFNEEKTIRRCIESIDRAASNYQGTTEIIVVNDGSTDDTRKIASDAILNLKNSSGKVFNIPNSGKGFALRYGLMRISGDVVFRIDTDSILDEKAIGHVVSHFRDPLVGSVSGMILPMEEKSIWQKITFLDFVFVYMFYKKEEELMDSIMVQSGAFSVFRMDALRKVGGWLDNRFGEDGEITFRLGRYGYKNEIEPHAIALTDQPGEFHNFREQRVRWNMGYYYTRSTHFGLFKEFRGPRTIMYALTMYVHGLDFTYAISLPFFILGLVIEYFDHTIPKSVIFEDLYRILIIDVILFALQHVFHLYYICKFKRFDLVPYIPLMRLYSLVHQMLFRTEALEILITWSSKWHVHNKESFHALRKTLKASMMR
jgi:cellulose synthase/poly-beta-1,6-N-acetylglucosamine synthase-like glycosyltransferase